MTPTGTAARKLGAIAGVTPVLAIVLLFAISGSHAQPADVATSLEAIALISIVAGWSSGPFAVRHRWFAATCFYSVAWSLGLTLLALVQAAVESWSTDGFDAGAIVLAVVGRAAYAPFSAPYFLIPAFVLGAIWIGALRAFTRLWSGGGSAGRVVGMEADPEPKYPGQDPIRLGVGAAGIIAGYAVAVAAISASAREPGELGPPEAVPRPLLLAGLLMVPAAIAFVGALRRSGPILIAAGVLCLLQAFVAFSGVTIPFVVPALLLVALGAEQQDPVRKPALVAGILVIFLGLGAWLAALGMTETTCWVARTASDGRVVYTPMPIPAGADFGSGSGQVQFELAADDQGQGCADGQLTAQGAGVAALFGIGAIALATLGSIGPVPRWRATAPA
jgi:hypothetical protein